MLDPFVHKGIAATDNLLKSISTKEQVTRTLVGKGEISRARADSVLEQLERQSAWSSLR